MQSNVTCQMSNVLCMSLKAVLNIFRRHHYLTYFLLFELAFLLFFYIQSAMTFADPDSFYHAKMAVLIKEQGVVTDFPWFQFTVLKNYYIDHHFLYHILLVPFVVIMPALAGVKLATIFFASLTVVAFYWLLNSLKVKGAWFYSLILMVTDPFIFRINLAKAQALALIIFFLAIYFISKRKYSGIALLSFLYVWLYGGWPLVLVLSVLYAVVNAIFTATKKFEFKKKRFLFYVTGYMLQVTGEFFSKHNLRLLMSAFGGVALGLIINPYFPKNLYFYWQQIFEIAVVNYKEIIGVGAEWYPYDPVGLVANASIVFLIFITAATFFVLSFKKQNVLSVTLFILSILFLGLTLKSRRNVEYLIPIMLLFSAIALDLFLRVVNVKNFWREFKGFLFEQKIFILAFLVPVVMMPYIVIRDVRSVKSSYNNGIPFEQFEKAMDWLKENSQAGEIVFHSDWDESPILFYHNSKNYYIVGLDPTFMYKYDQELYWQWERITTVKDSRDLGEKLKNNFRAKYVFISLDRHQNMEKIFSNSPDVRLVYRDGEAVVYEVR